MRASGVCRQAHTENYVPNATATSHSIWLASHDVNRSKPGAAQCRYNRVQLQSIPIELLRELGYKL